MNPFFTKNKLTHNYPNFDKIKPEYFLEAIDKGVKDKLNAIDRIANNTKKPTYKNTIVALEKSGEFLEYVLNIYFNMIMINYSNDLTDMEMEINTKYNKINKALLFNDKIFKKIDFLYKNKDKLKLTEEESHILNLEYNSFIQHGALLNSEQKKMLITINSELTKATMNFNRYLNMGEKLSFVVFDDKNLDGLYEDDIKELKENAERMGLKNKYLIHQENCTQNSYLSLVNRELRKKLLNKSINRGVKNKVSQEITKILKFRQEKAKILGFNNFSEYVLQDTAPKTPENLNNFLNKINKIVADKSSHKLKEIEEVFYKETGETKIKAHDVHCYQSLLESEKLDYNPEKNKEYFEINSVLKNGVFFAAKKLYGLRFKERKDLPTYHPDVMVFEVFDKKESLGICLFDLYRRDNKCGGAWMSNFIQQSNLFKTKPIILISLNIIKASTGPTFLYLSEIKTLFHEFGHSLHTLLSNVTLPSISGTNVPNDFCEFPSQFNEQWAIDNVVIKNYAKHYKTKKYLSQKEIKKIQKYYNDTDIIYIAEYLLSVTIDQAFHQNSKTLKAQQLSGFEKRAIKKTGINCDLLLPRYKTHYFSHIFSEPEGYAAEYYSYIWSEVLVANAVKWFKDNGGLTLKNGRRFRDMILSKGNSKEIVPMFEEWQQKPIDDKLFFKFKGLD